MRKIREPRTRIRKATKLTDKLMKKLIFDFSLFISNLFIFCSIKHALPSIKHALPLILKPIGVRMKNS